MTPLEHPNLARLRNARAAYDMAERFFRAEVERAMSDRVNRDPICSTRYKVDAVAEAANVSRQRVYQIVEEQKARARAVAP